MTTKTTTTIRRGHPEPLEKPSFRRHSEFSAHTVHYNGKRYLMTVEHRMDFKDKPKGPRAYIWGMPDPEGGHPPYSIKGDDAENDKAWRKYNNEEVKIQRHFLSEAVAGKWRFSRKAGCSCGCSPGFILQEGCRGLGSFSSLYIHVKSY